MNRKESKMFAPIDDTQEVRGDRFLTKAIVCSLPGVEDLRIKCAPLTDGESRSHTVAKFEAATKEELERFVGKIDPNYEKVKYGYNPNTQRHCVRCITYILE